MFDLIVVGAGASGMMASIFAARNGKKVLLLEHMNCVGKKVLITGKGRCNVTNNSDVQNLLNNVAKNSKFLYSSFYSFTAQDTMDFFEQLGVSLKTERGNRVFPVSDKAREIVNALEHELKSLNVTIKYEKVIDLMVEDSEIKGVKTKSSEYYADNVFLATGGKSYSGTGSTGDGYNFAEKVSHTVTKIVPSLVPIVTEEKFCSEMMGLSLKNVTLTLKDKESKKPVYSELGEMLFTHFGVSGPLVLSASCHIQKMQQDRYSLEIDLKPALSEKQLDARIQRDFALFQNKDISNALVKLLPAKMIPVVIKLSGMQLNDKVNQITKEQRKSLISIIKAFPLKVKCFRPIEEAIITSGGVDVKEINPKTMQSKLILGLYFIGEILDVDAYTGGYNLQIAFSTAYVAANSI